MSDLIWLVIAIAIGWLIGTWLLRGYDAWRGQGQGRWPDRYR